MRAWPPGGGSPGPRGGGGRGGGKTPAAPVPLRGPGCFGLAVSRHRRRITGKVHVTSQHRNALWKGRAPPMVTCPGGTRRRRRVRARPPASFRLQPRARRAGCAAAVRNWQGVAPMMCGAGLPRCAGVPRPAPPASAQGAEGGQGDRPAPATCLPLARSRRMAPLRAVPWRDPGACARRASQGSPPSGARPAETRGRNQSRMATASPRRLCDPAASGLPTHCRRRQRDRAGGLEHPGS